MRTKPVDSNPSANHNYTQRIVMLTNFDTFYQNSYTKLKQTCIDIYRIDEDRDPTEEEILEFIEISYQAVVDSAEDTAYQQHVESVLRLL